MEQDTRARAGGAMLADPLTGHLLDGRYRIGQRIARGGMAAVYEAVDVRLDRVCAVKTMHRSLGDDVAFAERFKREARAAARLSHPNVVNVFDQGEDPDVEGGTLYLVMELVPGHTLRDTIRAEAPMTPTRALTLLEPVVSALAAAHRAGVIHRDIKPENVLIADDGRIKVADFGLAKAVSADTQNTATGGVIIGTVSYLAPELVVDGTSDARADVYAVGVVLYEMLTGHKPHEGESPIAVAYKHVHEDVPPPSRVVPGIPPYVDALVARATARDRAQRPADAGVLLHQLHRVAQAVDGGVWDDEELTTDLAPPPPPTEDTTMLEVDLVPVAPAEFVAPPAPPPVVVASTSRPRRPRRRRGPALLTVALVVALAAGVGAYWFGWARYTATPGVLGMTRAAATHKLDRAGFDVTVGQAAFSESVPKGRVVGTDPDPGARVVDHGTITLSVSLGKERYDVPKVKGLDVDHAQDALASSHLTYGRAVPRWSDTVPAGTVMFSNPAQGSRQRPATVVDLTVSRGPRPVHLTDWTGKSAARAERVLAKQHLEVQKTEEFSDQVAAGQVISQDPPTGVLHHGDAVKLVVSKGPELVEVPGNLRAMGIDAATQTLEDLGFKVRVDHAALYLGLGFVAGSTPSGGDEVPKGSTITLHIV